MEKIIIIGGYGNVGLGVTKQFLADGFDVTVVGRPNDFPNPVPGTKRILVDRQNVDEFKAALSKEKYDYAIDLVCFTLDHAKIDYELFREVKHFIFVSSGAVYGPLHSNEIPIPETMRRVPNWGYGITKKMAEDFFMQKFMEEGFPVTIFRPTVCYGRQYYSVRQIGMDNSWIDRIKKGKPIVTGNPYILRNFLYVDDAIGAFTGALKHDWCKGQAYNFGAIRGYDWGTYHRTMMEIIGKEVEMVEVPLATLQASKKFEVSPMITTNYVFNGLYAGEKIARDIPEFCPCTDLKTGLTKQLEFLERHNMIPDSDTIEWEDELIAAQRKSVEYLQSL